MDNLPKHTYNIIYADPPWFYNDRRNSHTRFCGGARTYYDVMTVDEICALPVHKLAATHCYLFLWCTPPNDPWKYQVMEAWGFKYVTKGFCWVKTNKKNGQPFFGIGYYTKSNSEDCWLGYRGPKPFKNSDYVSQVIMSPREAHSKKPDIVREKIVKFCGNVPRIELFARDIVPGWHVWGNEVCSTIYPAPEWDRLLYTFDAKKLYIDAKEKICERDMDTKKL